jgi:hypothetical protein
MLKTKTQFYFPVPVPTKKVLIQTKKIPSRSQIHVTPNKRAALRLALR